MPRPSVNRQAIMELARDGVPRPQIATRLGCSVRAISNVYKAENHRPHHFLSPERLARLEWMLDDGWSFAEIHRTEGVAESTLRVHFPGRAWTYSQNGTFQAHTQDIRPIITRRKAA